MVTKTLLAIAGSILNLSSANGVNIPKRPAILILIIIAKPIRIDKFLSLNQNKIKIAVIKANIIPLKKPTKNSFDIIFLIFEDINSLVAKSLTVTVKVCVAALPPIEATIGIKIANATTFSIFSSKKPITKEAITAVIKFNVNQINLFFVISIAESPKYPPH